MCFMMSKKTIALLLGVGNGLVVVGISMVLVANTGEPGTMVGLAGVMLALVGWIGTLVKQAKEHQWSWFAGTLVAGLIGTWLFGGIYILIYLIRVPETPHYPLLASKPDLPAYQPMQQDTHAF
jgi:hypothetical protein